MDLKDFNAKLAERIIEAKRIEKTDPKRSISYWIKIAEFCLDFIKSPNIDRQVAFMIKKKTESIIRRAKELKRAHIDAYAEATPHRTDTERGSVAILESQLPSPPADEFDLTPDDFSDHNAVAPDRTGTPQGSRDADISDLMKTLGAIPQDFQEITPKDFDGSSIIPRTGKSSSFDLDQAKQIDLDLSKLKFDDIDISAAATMGSNKPPGPIKPRRDPFADTKDLESDGKKGTLTCFACGASISPDDKHCPSCGAKLD